MSIIHPLIVATGQPCSKTVIVILKRTAYGPSRIKMVLKENNIYQIILAAVMEISLVPIANMEFALELLEIMKLSVLDMVIVLVKTHANVKMVVLVQSVRYSNVLELNQQMRLLVTDKVHVLI